MQPDTYSQPNTWLLQLNAVKANDEKVLKHLYKSGYNKVERYVLTNKGSAEQAKDIYQEAFIAVWRNIQLDKFQPQSESALSGYLYQIAKNKWIDYLRSAHHKNMFRSGEVENSFEQADELPEEQLEYINDVKFGFRQLNDNCKEVLTRFYYRNESMKTISEAMDWTEATARNNKYRCLERLREIVKKHLTN
jgi:RNA polymerase sigma factor (sigma-70 family)